MERDPVVTNPTLCRVVEHYGENIGETETRVLFVELKAPSDGAAGTAPTEPLGPSGGEGLSAE